MDILKTLSRRRKTARSHYDAPLRRDDNYEEIDMAALSINSNNNNTSSSSSSSSSTPPADSLALSQPPTPQPHRHSEQQEQEDTSRVKLRRITDGGRRVFVNLPLPSYELNADGSPKRRFVSNRVRTSKYTPLTFVPKNLFEQFRRAANMYFLAQAILQLIPYFGIKNPALTVLPICVVVAISAVKDGFEDYQRHKVDARYNSTITYTLLGYDNVNYPAPKKNQQPPPSSEDEDSEKKKGYFGRSVSMDVRVGDFILLRNGESCPADAVLLSSSDPTGVCFVETKDLDGETNLKPRYCVPELSHIQSGTECLNDVHLYIDAPAPTPDLYSFEGTMVLLEKHHEGNGGWKERKKIPINIDNIVLRGHVVRNTHWAVALVLYTGPESKIILNSNKTPSKRSRIEKQMNQEIIIAFVVLVLLCLVCAILAGVMKAEDDADAGTSLYSRQTDSPAFVGFMNFWSSLIIFQNIIPISLYVSIEFVKTFHAYFIWSDIDMYDEASDTPCVPKSWNLSDDLGQVEYLFSDKTGTLTRNIMEFRECSIDGKRYGNNGFAPESEGARGARLRRERQEQRAASTMTTGPPPAVAAAASAVEEDASQQINLLGAKESASLGPVATAEEDMAEKRDAGDDSSFQERRAGIFEEYKRALTSLFTPKYSSLDPKRLSFADPAVLWDLHPSDSTSKEDKETTHRDKVQEFFMNLALCHTVIVEKIDRNGKAIIEDDDEDGGDNLDELQPQVIEDDKASATNEKTGTGFREAMKNRGRRFKRKVKGERRVTRHASRASRASTRGEEFQSIANVERPDIVDMTVDTQIVYKAESPDEAALVSAARDVGFAFVARRGKQLFVDFLGVEYEFELLNVLEFNSTRKRMSVIVKRPEPWNDIVLYCKGADNVILERLGSDTQSKELVQQTQDDIDVFSNDGLRTLVLACKKLEPMEYQDWAKRYDEASTAAENRTEKMEALQDEMERQLVLLGATAIEDKLQEGVPQCIEDLRHAGIKVWVLTGDKLETAINIGYASSVLEAGMQIWTLRGPEASSGEVDLVQEIQNITAAMNKQPDGPENALIIEGAALTYLFETPERKQALLQLALLCKSVVCCRVSPLQKALVVEMVKDGVGAVTLAVGDGANDVSMIQSANIGVGIAGQEGVQASMASDYAIGQFRFLQKLLLVQGHWNYRRTSEMILNFFFKNLLFILPPLWFQIYSRFSGGLFYDYSLHQLYNVIFTVAPVVVLGCSDQDITAPFLKRFPQTYEVGTHHLLYTRKLYCLYCLDAAWQSLVLYFGYYFVYYSKDPHPNGLPTSNLEFSTAVALAVVLLANIVPGFNTWYWTWFQIFFVAFGVVFTFVFVVIYSLFRSVDIYGMGFMVFSDLSFWMTLILVTIIAFLPRYAVAFVNQWYFPNVVSTARHLELDERRRKHKKLGKRCCC